MRSRPGLCRFKVSRLYASIGRAINGECGLATIFTNARYSALPWIIDPNQPSTTHGETFGLKYIKRRPSQRLHAYRQEKEVWALSRIQKRGRDEAPSPLGHGRALQLGALGFRAEHCTRSRRGGPYLRSRWSSKGSRPQ